eukprot:5786721-Pyramimonas_sp.AAC.1
MRASHAAARRLLAPPSAARTWDQRMFAMEQRAESVPYSQGRSDRNEFGSELPLSLIHISEPTRPEPI